MLSLETRPNAAPSGDLGMYLPYQKGFVVVRIRCESGKKPLMLQMVRYLRLKRSGGR